MKSRGPYRRVPTNRSCRSQGTTRGNVVISICRCFSMMHRGGEKKTPRLRGGCRIGSWPVGSERPARLSWGKVAAVVVHQVGGEGPASCEELESTSISITVSQLQQAGGSQVKHACRFEER